MGRDPGVVLVERQLIVSVKGALGSGARCGSPPGAGPPHAAARLGLLFDLAGPAARPLGVLLSGSGRRRGSRARGTARRRVVLLTVLQQLRVGRAWLRRRRRRRRWLQQVRALQAE